jgi:osmotically-inducible protein OsmY
MKTDGQLQHDVLAQLEWEPSVEASHIGVTAKDGGVTLTGSVATYAEKMRAEEVTKKLYGVMAVANDIEVKIPGSHVRNDSDIAAAALNALRWNTSVPDEKLKVTVRNGWVTLEGTVEWRFQREAAEDAVRPLTGVHGVVNRIVVKAPVKPTDVKQKIEAAFKRSAELDARRVGVEATDGKVVLRGHVRSWTEREEAQQAAWAAPGVVEVDNQLRVML